MCCIIAIIFRFYAEIFLFDPSIILNIIVPQENKGDSKCLQKVTFRSVDTLTWQMLASVVVPGYTINRICALSTYLMNKSNKVSKNACRIIVPAIALASIPFIIKPIDHATDYLLDSSLRKIEI